MPGQVRNNIKKKRIRNSKNMTVKLPSALTKETIDLKTKLQNQQTSGRVMFGHHDSLAYGRSNGGWRNSSPGSPTSILNPASDQSDISNVVNYYPKIFSWDLALDNPNINTPPSKDTLINNINRNDLATLIQRVHKSGGINTICWHCHNPKKENGKYLKADEKLDNGNFPDAISEILAKGTNQTKTDFLKWLNDVADFIAKLKDSAGKRIPIIFRPLHEVTKNAPFFWWHLSSRDNYKALWNLIYNTIRAKADNVLFCFCLNDFFLINGWQDKGDNTHLKNGFWEDISKSIPNNFEILAYDAYQRFYLESQFSCSNFINANKYFTKYPERYYDPTKESVKIDKYTKPQNKPSVDNNIYGKYNFDEGVKYATYEHFGFLKRQTELNVKYIMKLADDRNKIVALTEIGADYLYFQSNWFTQVLLPILQKTYPDKNNKPMNFAYTTLWRNPNPKDGDLGEYYAPFLPSNLDNIINKNYTTAYNTDFESLFNFQKIDPNDNKKMIHLLEFLGR